MSQSRYIVSKINNRFVVTDSQRAGIIIMNDQAQPADNANPADMQFFGMGYDQADALADKLNATYHR